MCILLKRVRVPIVNITYIDVEVESETEELALLEANSKLNEGNIATINIEVIQSNGTVHSDRVDDWEIGDYEFINDED